MFFFLLFGPLLLSNLIIFLFLIHLNDLKCYKSATWSSTNHLSTLIAAKQYTKNFWGVWESAFIVFRGSFFEFLTPFTLGGHNFLISNPVLMIANVLDVPRGEVEVLFGHQKQHCSITGQSTLGSLVNSSSIDSLAGSIPTYLSLMTGG